MNVNLAHLVLSRLDRGYPATSCELILKMQQAKLHLIAQSSCDQVCSDLQWLLYYRSVYSKTSP
ncbi:hypothetical protein D8Y22_15430, partial [Salinadaptatus halalkaliphilus]